MKFTSVQESKAAGDWGQIVFYDSSVDASYDGSGDYASGSILEYCTVEYGSGIQLNLANPFINQGTIRYHSGRGNQGPTTTIVPTTRRHSRSPTIRSAITVVEYICMDWGPC